VIESPLATVIHISDLHFGPSIYNQLSIFKKLVSQTPLQGRFPHSFEVARALAIEIRRILADREKRGVPVIIVHTGDLTRAGEPEELLVGATFLHSAHLTGAGGRVGLDSSVLDIPGNHDIWQRYTPSKKAIVEDYYFRQPYPLEFEFSFHGGKIVFHGLDSNRGSKSAHWKANGEIDPEQLDTVCANIHSDRSSGTIHIVCLHHPLAGTSDQRLNRREVVALRLSEAGASFIFAGHVHEHVTFPASAEMPSHLVAGSACQMGTDNSFLVHDLFPTQLECTNYRHDRDRWKFLPRSI
jgi:3',5'-cyclic AMP phosphodiesterase CpdA